MSQCLSSLKPPLPTDSASTNDREGCGEDGAVLGRSRAEDMGLGADGGVGKIGDRLIVVPANARVICFPLQPKPHEVVDQPWVQRLWLGLDENSTSTVL